MGFFTRGRNPKVSYVFTDEHIQEMDDIYQQEKAKESKKRRKDREEDFILLESLRGNWSIHQFVSVAQQRGKTWRFISAMADKANELQGVTMLHFVSETAQQNFTLAVAKKSGDTIRKLTEQQEKVEAEASLSDDPFLEQIYQDAKVHIIELNRQAPKNLQEKMNRRLDD